MHAAPHFARLVLLLALVLVGLVGCAADIPESGQDDLRNFFDRTDTNGDGKLSKEELKAHFKTILVQQASQSGETSETRYTDDEAEQMYQMYHGPKGNQPDKVRWYFVGDFVCMLKARLLAGR